MRRIPTSSIRGVIGVAAVVMACSAIGCEQRVVGVRNSWANNPTMAGETRYVKESYAPKRGLIGGIGDLLFGWTKRSSAKKSETVNVPTGTLMPTAGGVSSDRPARSNAE